MARSRTSARRGDTWRAAPLSRVMLVLASVMSVALVSCGPVSEDELATQLTLDSARALIKDLTAQRDAAMKSDSATASVLLGVDSALKGASSGKVTIQQGSPCAGGAECASTREAALRTAVQNIVAQLKSTQTRLAAAQSSAAVAREDSVTRMQAAQLQAVVDTLVKTANARLAQLDSLRDELDQLAADTVDASVELDSLRQLLAAISATDDSVFWTAGTRDQLIKLGAVAERGGTFLTFGFGKTLVPLANPPLTGWHAIRKSRDSVLALPMADKWYSVVSAHPATLLGADRSKNDLVGGKVHIASPNDFWRTSRYLILEQR